MANYIQDFLYTELPEGLIPDVIQWFRVSSTKDLPAPSAMYLMMAALTDDGVGYLCIEDNGSYRWVNLVDSNTAHKIAELTTKLEKLKDVVTSEGLDIKTLQDKVDELENTVNDLKNKLNKYPDMPEYDPTVAYYTLVFTSEGKPYWCKNYFA